MLFFKKKNPLKPLEERVNREPKKKQFPELIRDSGSTTVGRMSFHNGNFSIRGDQAVEIGSFCAFGKEITVLSVNHDYNFPVLQGTFYQHFFNQRHPGTLLPKPNKARTKGPIKIGSDVWIGDKATIFSGVSIGNGACIAHSAVVVRDVPPFSIVGGIPAKIIGYRYSDEIIQLLDEKIRWWTWTDEKIKRNLKFFNTNLNQSNPEQIQEMIV